MKHTLKTGISFGLTSGIITTLGLIVGLHSGTQSRMVIIGGILIIAIADAFSDALGIHVSEEAENKHTFKEIWESTIYTFLSKFIFALSFIIPMLLLPLIPAIITSVIWGLSLLTLFSFYISRGQKTTPWIVALEHLVIAIIVILSSHFIGTWIRTIFS